MISSSRIVVDEDDPVDGSDYSVIIIIVITLKKWQWKSDN